MSSKTTILEDACKYVAANKDIVIGHDYFIKFFQANEGSATADKLGLAIIAANITRVAAKNIDEHIAALQASEKEMSIRGYLDYCAHTYLKNVSNLDNAMKDTALGPTQDLWTANVYLWSVIISTDTCESVLADKNLTSLLLAENSEFTKKAYIALFVNPSKWN